MLNPNMLASLLNVNPQQMQMAWKKAQQVSQGIQTKEQALSAISNIGMDKVAKARALLNNPIANAVARACGLDINKAKDMLDSLTNPSQTFKPTSNDIDYLKQGMKQLK